jgi:hypothetical protein
MGDLLCRLTYFRYTGAISERNMDRRLRVRGCQLVSAGQWRTLPNTNIYKCQTLLGGKVLNLTDARSLSASDATVRS